MRRQIHWLASNSFHRVFQTLISCNCVILLLGGKTFWKILFVDLISRSYFTRRILYIYCQYRSLFIESNNYKSLNISTQL
ncbi:unnamed protein product [Rhizophagus irregularis]|nr:unnamed protein product [Rhizophagus irregularis]CAB5373758.1 unnamed protein product [Rhizophagus irregularis]